jgi:hypothetical protein
LLGVLDGLGKFDQHDSIGTTIATPSSVAANGREAARLERDFERAEVVAVWRL